VAKKKSRFVTVVIDGKERKITREQKKAMDAMLAGETPRREDWDPREAHKAGPSFGEAEQDPRFGTYALASIKGSGPNGAMLPADFQRMRLMEAQVNRQQEQEALKARGGKPVKKKIKKCVECGEHVEDERDQSKYCPKHRCQFCDNKRASGPFCRTCALEQGMASAAHRENAPDPPVANAELRQGMSTSNYEHALNMAAQGAAVPGKEL